MKRNRVRRWGAWLALLLVLIVPRPASAHAMLEKADPAPQSSLNSAPAEVDLRFNERVEKELYAITLLDGQGRKVATGSASLSADQQNVQQRLPQLANGLYTVSYRVISADGHPVQGAYTFSIGMKENSAQMRNGAGVENSGNAGNGTSAQNPLSAGVLPRLPNTALFNTVRLAYFLSLLLLSGWLLWGRLAEGKQASTTDAPRRHRQASRRLLAAFAVSFAGMAALQLPIYTDDWHAAAGLGRLLVGTGVGWFWLATFALGTTGFFSLGRSRRIDRLWAVLLLAAKSMSGHAAGSRLAAAAIPLDFVHLLAAAIWVGGLFHIALGWRKDRARILRFLPVFSRAALISLALLIGTGMLSTLLLLPRFSAVLDTEWGLLLMIKSGLVVLVLGVGARIRRGMRQSGARQLGTWLRTDFALMLGIVMVVGIFTYMSPIPQNKPLTWDDRQGPYRLQAVITPSAPGVNQFRVRVSVPAGSSGVKQVSLLMTCDSHPGMGAIEIPLNADLSDRKASEADFAYFSQGPYIPFAGKWTVELRIMNTEDDETVMKKAYTIF